MSEISIDGKPIPIERESPNSRADRDGEPPRFIVLHSTGGVFAGAVSWMMSLAGKVSAHFVVSRTGEIRQLVSVHRIAYHAGQARFAGRRDLNACSLGIEMEHYDKKQDWPAVQVEAVAKLAAALSRKFNIDRNHIVSHAAIAYPRGRKIDPWEFPWQTFFGQWFKLLARLK